MNEEYIKDAFFMLTEKEADHLLKYRIKKECKHLIKKYVNRPLNELFDSYRNYDLIKRKTGFKVEMKILFLKSEEVYNNEHILRYSLKEAEKENIFGWAYFIKILERDAVCSEDRAIVTFEKFFNKLY